MYNVTNLLNQMGKCNVRFCFCNTSDVKSHHDILEMKQPKNCWAKAWARQRRVCGVWSIIIGLWSRLVLKYRGNRSRVRLNKISPKENILWLEAASATAHSKWSMWNINHVYVAGKILIWMSSLPQRKREQRTHWLSAYLKILMEAYEETWT